MHWTEEKINKGTECHAGLVRKPCEGGEGPLLNGAHFALNERRSVHNLVSGARFMLIQSR